MEEPVFRLEDEIGWHGTSVVSYDRATGKTVVHSTNLRWVGPEELLKTPEPDPVASLVEQGVITDTGGYLSEWVEDYQDDDDWAKEKLGLNREDVEQLDRVAYGLEQGLTALRDYVRAIFRKAHQGEDLKPIERQMKEAEDMVGHYIRWFSEDRAKLKKLCEQVAGGTVGVNQVTIEDDTEDQGGDGIIEFKCVVRVSEEFLKDAGEAGVEQIASIAKESIASQYRETRKLNGYDTEDEGEELVDRCKCCGLWSGVK